MHCGRDQSAPATSADDTASGWRGEAGAPGGRGITEIGIKPIGSIKRELRSQVQLMKTVELLFAYFLPHNRSLPKRTSPHRSRITIQDAKGFLKCSQINLYSALYDYFTWEWLEGTDRTDASGGDPFASYRFFWLNGSVNNVLYYNGVISFLVAVCRGSRRLTPSTWTLL